MKECRAIIFDMDGVIVDSEPRHERAFLDVVRDIGYGDRHGLLFADYIGRSDLDMWLSWPTSISFSGKPASGTRRVSRPREVPTKMISAPNLSRSSRAMASA